MPTRNYLCLYRRSTEQAPTSPPSPAQMQDMLAAWTAWKDKFKAQILDMGGKLKSSGKVVTTSGVADGPFIEAKEIVGGYMVIAAESYEAAVEVVREGPGMVAPGARIEIRELGDF
jgi:hypothetical protein